jgi:Ca-activated chloride channel family protein
MQNILFCILTLTPKMIAMTRLWIASAAMLLVIFLSCDQQMNSTDGKDLATEKKEIVLFENELLAQEPEYNTEDYDHIVENQFQSSGLQPLSTFSIDVDEASYSNVRRFLKEGTLPPAGAVRIEEMINYFDYDYPQPTGELPFSVNTEVGTCPWNTQHQLVHIGLKGKEILTDDLPALNLVFLVDVSGSMNDPKKLPLVKESLMLLTDKLRKKDKVAIVVYAGSAGLVLPATSGTDKPKIKEAISSLEAGGFNVGISSDDELVRLIERERGKGVFLSVLGYGTGNYKDNKMQLLADKGNGNHSYIDNINEAKKVLVNEFGSTLFTIAKDVKIQVEFNPAKVQSYRLIGYENRVMAAEDFNDDSKDAGEIGSGHTVTALYEIIPVGVKDTFTRKVDKLIYQSKAAVNTNSNELLTVNLRYKKPDGTTSHLISNTIGEQDFRQDNSANFLFSASVAEFGMLLRNSVYKQAGSIEQVLSLANSARGKDLNGYRDEFIQLVKASTSLVKP